MKHCEKCIANVLYMNNVKRESLGNISYNRYEKAINLLPDILKCIENSGYSYDRNKCGIYVSIHGVLQSLYEVDFINDENLTIIYSEIQSLNNSVFFDEKDGVIFFFHTNEKNHKYSPHVHASYSGNEISISLTDFHIKGSLKNLKKNRLAVDYVKANLDDFLEKWNNCIQNN